MQTGSVSWRSRPLRASDVTSFSTFVGGSPRAFGPDVERPSCARCGAPLFLVLQLYAPATCERQLLLYGCNNSACSLGGAQGGGAWVARRTRGPPVVAAPTSFEAAPASAPETDDWGIAAAWGDVVSVAKEGEGAAPTASDDAASDAASHVASHSDATADTNAAAVLLSAPTAVDGPWFTCYAVETEYGDAADDSDSESDSEDEGGSGGGALTERGGSRNERGAAAWGAGEWTHVQALLSAYNASEAAAGSADAYAGEEAPPGSALDASDDDCDEAVAGNTAVIINGARDKSGSGDRKGGSGGGSGVGGEKYEKTPAHLRYLLRFQRRLGGFPNQVLRYVWDDVRDVLWPVPPTLRPGVVPACACGAARRLEVQVMPTLLYGLKVEDAPGGGMDFLSVFVYSCEGECDVSQEEWVWVVV